MNFIPAPSDFSTNCVPIQWFPLLRFDLKQVNLTPLNTSCNNVFYGVYRRPSCTQDQHPVVFTFFFYQRFAVRRTPALEVRCVLPPDDIANFAVLTPGLKCSAHTYSFGCLNSV